MRELITKYTEFGILDGMVAGEKLVVQQLRIPGKPGDSGCGLITLDKPFPLRRPTTVIHNTQRSGSIKQIKEITSIPIVRQTVGGIAPVPIRNHTIMKIESSF